MQHLDGLDEVQQSHEFEIANLLAATGLQRRDVI